MALARRLPQKAAKADPTFIAAHWLLRDVEAWKRIDPNSVFTMMRKGQRYLRHDLNYEKVAECFRRGLKDNHFWYVFSINLAQVAMSEETIEESLSHAATATETCGRSERAAILGRRARLLNVAGDYVQSLRFSGEAMDLAHDGPFRQEALKIRSCGLAMLGELEEAKPLIEELVAQHSATTVWLLAKIGDPTRARSVFNKLHAPHPLDYLALGDLDSVYKSIEETIETDNGVFRSELIAELRVARWWVPGYGALAPSCTQPSLDGAHVFGHDGANDPAINTSVRLNPEHPTRASCWSRDIHLWHRTSVRSGCCDRPAA